MNLDPLAKYFVRFQKLNNLLQIFILFAAFSVISLPASAQQSMQSAEAFLKEGSLDVRPQLGFMNFDDSTGTGYTELAVGVTGSFNAIKTFNPLRLDPNKIYIGPESGLIYSHLSLTSSSVFILPLNLKLGYLITDRIRVGGHGGANLIYRSTSSAMQLSDQPQSNSASLDLYPNIGADVDVAITGNIALSLRPDWTLTPGSNIFSTTLALIIPLA
jgi:hypothetical protein